MNLNQAAELLSQHGNVKGTVEQLLRVEPTLQQLEEAWRVAHRAVDEAAALLAQHHGFKGLDNRWQCALNGE